MRALLLASLCLPGLTGAADQADLEARVRMARQIAREHNDAALVAQVEAVARRIQTGNEGDLDASLREVESAVGIDPGGWSMAGQPLAHPSPEMVSGLASLTPRLATAMRQDDLDATRALVAEMERILGDQAGLPDGRRPGFRPVDPPTPLPDEAAATRLFLDALASEGSAVRRLTAGEPLPDQMVRLYGSLLGGLNTIRPFVARHEPDRLADIDRLAEGIADLLLRLQQPAGHFPFPDLRGKNIRFGAMIERQLAEGAVEARDGWIVSPDPDGGSQFDTGVCGVALVAAGRVHGKPEWTAAGLRAADWALAQPCVPNFNYNAFSVSLLAAAYRETGESRFLDGALRKFRVGVAPGQAPNGRWMDSHNARTVYHRIILLGLSDLLDILPPDRAAERAEVDAVANPALRALLDEFDAMGITVEALPELLAFQRRDPANVRLSAAIQVMAASLLAKTTDGHRVKLGTAPDQLAALPLALP